MPTFITEYPKWIEANGEQVLVQNEEELKSLSLEPEKDEIKKDLSENYGLDIDLDEFSGVGGMGSLRAFYEAAKSARSDCEAEEIKLMELQDSVSKLEQRKADLQVDVKKLEDAMTTPAETLTEKPAEKTAKKTPPKL